MEIDKPHLQLRRLGNLPPVGGRDLKRLVSEQARRFFRADGNALLTDAEWIDVGEQNDRVALAAAVDESLVEGLADAAGAAGFTVDSITARQRTRSKYPRLDLLPQRNRSARRRRQTQRAVVLLGLGLMAWLAIGVWQALDLAAERARVARELAKLQAPADALVELRHQLTLANSAVDAVDNTAAGRGHVMTLLAAVVAALPDSGYVDEFSLGEDGKLRLGGVARRARRVASRLEEVGFASASVEAEPLTIRIDGRTWERFTIAVEGKP